MYTYFDQKFISKSWCISSLELIISPMEVVLSFESLLKSEFKIWAFIHRWLNLRYFPEQTSTSLESSLRANLHDDSCTSFFNRGFENKLDSWNMNSESIFRNHMIFRKVGCFLCLEDPSVTASPTSCHFRHLVNNITVAQTLMWQTMSHWKSWMVWLNSTWYCFTVTDRSVMRWEILKLKHSWKIVFKSILSKLIFSSKINERAKTFYWISGRTLLQFSQFFKNFPNFPVPKFI